MNNFNRDTFVGADRETRDKMLFDMFTATHDSIKTDHKRIKVLEKRKNTDTLIGTSISAVTGLFGGAIAVLTKPWWGGQ